MSRTQEESVPGRRNRARSTPPEDAPAAAPKRRRTASAASAPQPVTAASVTQAPPGSGDRDRMIAEAAYYRAERRGFVGDDAERRQDWLEAEAEIDRIIAGAAAGGTGEN